ncbi:Kazal-type serine protease inhibitor domain-containing protein [Mesorhizobium xinjiangense]|uniref:Kazal-type serine protease inhibitor domain-containing protein n=1 Tax=Mesorhizobium xinjiangense TaxID=2678685 RepID=UPI0012ECEDC5|nr:Kazal-type serine protease inhibitor domain-containing protein [Mesorhizobium xinjiangense]
MNNLKSFRFWIGAFALAATAILAACTVVVDEPRPSRPGVGPRPPVACTREYAPVCGQRGNTRRTFANACTARAAGYRVNRRGPCGASSSGSPAVCTREHAPVCGQRGGRTRTFSNACLARSAGYRVDHRGACRAGGGGSAGRPVACTMEYSPVCARRGNQRRTFGNACQARANNFTIMRRGRC